MKKPTITDVRKVCEQHEARQAIVIVFDAGRFAAVSYGATKAECAALAKTVDDIADGLKSGRVRAP